VVHLGLGDADPVRAEIRWTDGTLTVIEGTLYPETHYRIRRAH
jgi:hypothetical protein